MELPESFEEALAEWGRSQCSSCEHMSDEGDCPAFPKGIPDAIFNNDVEHDRVMLGQVGDYVFTSIPD